MSLYMCSVHQKLTSSPKAATIENDHCCLKCAEEHNGPGKFEKYSYSPESMGNALILSAWKDASEEDDFMYNDGWGYCGRFGSFLLTEDTRGFVEYDEYPDEVAADKQFQSFYMDGWGADESDIYISLERGGWQAFDGDSHKEIPAWPRCHKPTYEDHNIIDRDRILAAVRLYCSKTGYYPNVWESNERGMLTHVGKDVW